jgi:glycosyltransferase involved in cell wall biosynthesis
VEVTTVSSRDEGGVRRKQISVPLVSVVMVFYRDLIEVEALLENLTPFRSGDLELIVIDGGSDDGTLEFLRSNDARIDYWRSETDTGIYSAMNEGIAEARGEYVLHLNAGDRLLHIPFEELADCLIREVDVLSCRVLDECHREFVPSVSFLSRFRNSWHHQGTFYRRAVHLGYDQSYRVFGDFDHNLRLAKQHPRVEISNAVVALHRGGGLSHNLNHFSEVYRSVRKSHGVGAMLVSYAYFKCQGLRSRMSRLFH